MEHQYTIELKHINLAPLDEKTSELYRQLRNKKENRKRFFYDRYISEVQQTAWFKKYLHCDDDYMFSIWDTREKKFVGGIGIYDINNEVYTAEIGRIIVDKNYAGMGYGAEAICGMIGFAREVLAIKVLYANIKCTNIASIKSFEKNGFTQYLNKESNVIEERLML